MVCGGGVVVCGGGVVVCGGGVVVCGGGVVGCGGGVLGSIIQTQSRGPPWDPPRPSVSKENH